MSRGVNVNYLPVGLTHRKMCFFIKTVQKIDTHTETCSVTWVALGVTLWEVCWAAVKAEKASSLGSEVPPWWEMEFSPFPQFLSGFETLHSPSQHLPVITAVSFPRPFLWWLWPSCLQSAFGIQLFPLAFGWRTRWPHKRSSSIGHQAPRDLPSTAELVPLTVPLPSLGADLLCEVIVAAVRSSASPTLVLTNFL